jgi:hypothetical protein
MQSELKNIILCLKKKTKLFDKLIFDSGPHQISHMDVQVELQMSV